MLEFVQGAVQALLVLLRALLQLQLPDPNDVISYIVVSYWKIAFLYDGLKVDRVRYLKSAAHVLDKKFGYRFSIMDCYDDPSEHLSCVGDIDSYIDSKYREIVTHGLSPVHFKEHFLSTETNKIVFVIKKCGVDSNHFLVLCCVNHFYIDGTHFHTILADIAAHYLSCDERIGFPETVSLLTAASSPLLPRCRPTPSVTSVRAKFLPVSFIEAERVRTALTTAMPKTHDGSPTQPLTIYNSVCALWSLYVVSKSTGPGRFVAHTVGIRSTPQARNSGNYIKLVFTEVVMEGAKTTISEAMLVTAVASRLAIQRAKDRCRRGPMTLLVSAAMIPYYRPLIVFDSWCSYRHLPSPTSPETIHHCSYEMSGTVPLNIIIMDDHDYHLSYFTNLRNFRGVSAVDWAAFKDRVLSALEPG